MSHGGKRAGQTWRGGPFQRKAGTTQPTPGDIRDSQRRAARTRAARKKARP